MKKWNIALILTLIMCFCSLTVSAVGVRDTSTEEVMAQDLKVLGLFQGVSDTEFELDRAPTRIEAIIMLIRVLGKDKDALSGKSSHPFTDVPDWADSYVGYAYENGLSNGTSATTFGEEDASAEMYVTFILRALGYSDKNGEDFVWSNPFSLAREIGIIPNGTDTTNFLRADVVLVSYAALNACIKNNDTTLAEKLISEGVFTAEQFEKNYDSGKITLMTAQKELTSEQVYEKCSPSVFYIEIFDKNRNLTSTGSGFFIDNYGTAVTNYHVIDGASSATATISDTGETYNILGVYDYSKENDWAVIAVDGTGFKGLKFADKSTVVGGSTVYAIGSPLGLQNTISQGLISNVSREVDGVTYIQTSAPMSHGSSGGALINKYGEVIGITSASFSDGENLNLAIPVSVIKGYDPTNLTAFNELVGTTQNEYFDENTTREEQAYAWLSAFIEVYANSEYEGNKEYAVEYNTDNGYIEQGLTLYEDCISVYTFEVYGTTTYYCSVDLGPGMPPYLYYSFNIDKPYYYKASEFFDAATISRYNEFVFQDGIGTSEKEGHQLLCGGYITEILDFVNNIFDEYVSEFGYYSVSDFGFINFR